MLWTLVVYTVSYKVQVRNGTQLASLALPYNTTRRPRQWWTVKTSPAEIDHFGKAVEVQDSKLQPNMVVGLQLRQNNTSLFLSSRYATTPIRDAHLKYTLLQSILQNGESAETNDSSTWPTVSVIAVHVSETPTHVLLLSIFRAFEWHRCVSFSFSQSVFCTADSLSSCIYSCDRVTFSIMQHGSRQADWWQAEMRHWTVAIFDTAQRSTVREEIKICRGARP